MKADRIAASRKNWEDPDRRARMLAGGRKGNLIIVARWTGRPKPKSVRPRRKLV